MMRSLRLGSWVSCTVAGVFALGCGSEQNGGTETRPIVGTEATSTLNQRVDELIRGLGDSTARVDTTDGTNVATGSVDSVLGNTSPCAPVGSTGSASSGSSSVGDVPRSTTQALDDLLHRVAQGAKDHVFRDELVEFEDGNQVVYKIDPFSACDTDTRCLEKLTMNPVRFAVTANSDDSLDVALLIGEARLNPATAHLGVKKLSVRVDLAQAMDALRLFVNVEDQTDFPERLAGVLEAAIEKQAEGDFVISSSIVQAFDLLVGQAKGKPVAVKVAPSQPTSQLTINANTNTLGYAFNLGAVDVQVAGAAVCDDQCGSKEKVGTFSGHLGGWTGAVSISQGAQELTLSNLGLGGDTSYVALDADRLGTLDVNPNNGRKLSVTFKKVSNGTLVTFNPALDIKLALMLNKLSESMRVDMPTWLTDQIFDVMLGGDAVSSVLIPAPTCDASGQETKKNQLGVVSGTLTLKASGLASPVTVAAGMCLVPVENADGNAHPFSKLAAGVCE